MSFRPDSQSAPIHTFMWPTLLSHEPDWQRAWWASTASGEYVVPVLSACAQPGLSCSSIKLATPHQSRHLRTDKASQMGSKKSLQFQNRSPVVFFVFNLFLDSMLSASFCSWTEKQKGIWVVLGLIPSVEGSVHECLLLLTLQVLLVKLKGTRNNENNPPPPCVPDSLWTFYWPAGLSSTSAPLVLFTDPCLVRPRKSHHK